MSYRISKLNSLIQQQISEIISKNLHLKQNVFFTITKVDTSKDLSYTDVFVSVFPELESNYFLKTIKKEIYFIQKKLNQRLIIKKFPRIRFHLDKTEIEADKIEKILKKLDF